MKRFLVPVTLLVLLICCSWGREGHDIVGLIAERHLTPQAKAAVKELLNGQSLSEVASWADEVRSQPQYKYSAPQHFANFPGGLTYKQFIDYANGGDIGPNVIFAIPMTEATLMSSATPFEQKVDALKFLTHYIGDIMQPMHISHKEDKGGNTIQVQFDGKGTNLHSLWDSKLIDKQGLSPEQIADKVDHVSASETSKWLNTSMNQWAWESYQISEKLYSEVAQNNKLDDTYYQSHIGIVNTRLEQAGLRLANELNRIFKNSLTHSNEPTRLSKYLPLIVAESQHIELNDVAKNIGKFVAVSGKVFDYKELSNMTLVNVGGDYPNQLLTVVLKGEARKQAALINGKIISVTGTIMDYKGKPEIEVKDLQNITILPKVKEVWDNRRSGGE